MVSSIPNDIFTFSNSIIYNLLRLTNKYVEDAYRDYFYSEDSLQL